METNLCVAGFGGQGVMTLGKFLASATCDATDKNVTFFPSYGAEQRGGTANCFVVISDGMIGAPLGDVMDDLIVMNGPSLAKFLPTLKQGGTLCGLGVLKSGDTLLDASRLQNNTRLHMLNFPYGEYDILPETVEMIEQGRVHPRDFYSHVVPFTEIDRAMHLLETREAFKVVLDFDA